MSRLEDLTHRFLTQRAALDLGVELIADIDGIIVELGLGKGRTFDHLRERLSGRTIYVFDHELSCEPEYAPAPEYRMFGNITETLPAFCERFSGQAALIHSDVGTRDREHDQPLVDCIATQLETLITAGGVIVSDRPMQQRGWSTLPSLREMEHFPYFMYRQK